MRKVISEIYLKIKSYFFNIEEIADPDNFLKGLNPIENIEDKDYLNTLKWAIDKKDITNIALSGPYGAGKSSIIKTFEKEYDSYNYEFLNISLATFKEKCNEHEENNSTDSKTEEISQESIEKSILQQMFYKEDVTSIPNSRFKRITNVKHLKTKTILFFIWCISILELFSPYTLMNHVFNYTPYIDIVVLVMSYLVMIGVLYFIYMVIKKISAIKLQKLSLQTPEITLAENDSDISVLNKHIDEIIYFFEMTNYNVVIIEDLDRFNKPEIFIKLRELNKLLNESKQIDQPINFIYAIRDNMFINNERTKFFDFFIPVIPVINFTNSFTKLKKMFEEANLLESMNEGFLKDISRYIHDMRLLQNIFSEFIQYKQHLEKNLKKYTENVTDKKNTITLDNNEIFAIAIYKNHYPADFALLHEQKGMVFNIFEHTKKMQKLSVLTLKFNNKIKDLKEKIENLQYEKDNNIIKLRQEYVSGIIKKYPTLVAFSMNNQRITISQIIQNKEYFDKLKELSKIQFCYYYQTNSYQTTTSNFSTSFEEIEKEVNPKSSFDAREKIIALNIDEEEDKLKKEIKEIETEINRIQKLDISKLLQEFKIEDILDIKLLESDKQLLVYLIRYRWINELYRRYISYYYPGEETVEDISYILSIRNREQNPNYLLKLTQIDKIVADIHDEEYSIQAILNFDLLNYLLQDIKNKSKIIKIIEILKEDKNFGFIEQFLSLIDNNTKTRFLYFLIEQWQEFLPELFETEITESKKDEYIVLFIEKVFYKKHLEFIKKYLSEKKILQNIIDKFEEVDKLLNFIEANNIKFINIEDYEYNKNEVYKFIYNNNHYEINTHMLRILSEIKNVEEFNHRNYGTIIESKKDNLIKYIHENINIYINNVYLSISENEDELGTTLIDLFEIENISEESILNVFNHTKAMFTNINDLPQSLWVSALEKQRVFPTLSNLKSLQENEQENLSKIYVLNFFNETKNIFSFNIDYFEDLTEENREYFEEMLSNQRFGLAAFKRLVNCINFKFKNFHHLNENNDEKLEILLELDLLELTIDNYEQIREDRKHEIRVKLFENNLEKLIEKYNELGVLFTDMEMILLSNKISDDIKFTIFNEFTDEEIILILLEEFRYENTVENIYEVLMKNINHSFWPHCLIFIMKSSLSIDKKVEMFIQYNNFTHELIDECLNILGYPYTNLLDNANASTKVLKNDNIDKLVNKLQRIQYLGRTIIIDNSSYKVYKFKNKREIIKDNVTDIS